MKLYLQTRNENGQWETLAMDTAVDGDLEELADALERLASLKDRWVASQYLPPGTTWRVAQNGPDGIVPFGRPYARAAEPSQRTMSTNPGTHSPRNAGLPS